MMKKITCTILSFCLLQMSIYAQEPTPPPTLQAESYLLMEQTTGNILLEQNAHESLPPASVTKIMTLLLIYEAVASGQIAWSDIVTISEHSAGMGGSQVFLETGEQQTVETLTKCISIASANDAAVAMAEFIAGSEDNFVSQMNARAKELNMQHTNFLNACGLDVEGHETTAYDIALMSRELMKNFPEISQYTTTWQDTIIHTTRKGDSEFGLTNTNKLINTYSGITGLKTGSTSQALYCLSATATREDLSLIAVVLKAPDPTVRFEEASSLLDYGFANFTIQNGSPAGKVIGSTFVEKGESPFVSAIVKEEISVVLPKDTEHELETRVDLFPIIKAPIPQNTKIGELIYLLNGVEVGKTDLIAESSVEKANLQTILFQLLSQWVS